MPGAGEVSLYRKNNAAFIAHPKTASQAARVALTGCGWVYTSSHHEIDLPMPGQVISVIREPRDWCVSWYYHMPRTLPFDEWLPKFLRTNNYVRDGFFGVTHTTHLIFYSRLHVGFDAVMEDIGHPPVELPIVNKKNRPRTPVREYFTRHLTGFIPTRLMEQYDELYAQLKDQPFLRLR